MDGAEKVALPASPPAIEREQEVERQLDQAIDEATTAAEEEDEGKKGKSKGKGKAKELKPKRPLSSYFSMKSKKSSKSGEVEKVSSPATQAEAAAKEAEDLTSVLDQLNLAAVNNRAFSFSKESQELLEKFNQVLKDVIHGAPTAYGDLEKLFDSSEGQIKNMYDNMPPFLQNLVKSLPTKVMASLAPELLAASAEKPDEDQYGLNEVKGYAKKKAKSKVPSLKSLVSKQGAVTAMLRSILNFLKLRFPAFVTGTNVLLSLALFVLMFVLWYCHKRGREVRLENEKRTESDASSVSSAIGESSSGPSGTTTTPSRVPDLPSPPTAADAPVAEDTQRATVNDMPSVQNLPSPSEVPLPEGSDVNLPQQAAMEER
jgi:hypothetical protein